MSIGTHTQHVGNDLGRQHAAAALGPHDEDTPSLPTLLLHESRPSHALRRIVTPSHPNASAMSHMTATEAAAARSIRTRALARKKTASRSSPSRLELQIPDQNFAV